MTFQTLFCFVRKCDKQLQLLDKEHPPGKSGKESDTNDKSSQSRDIFPVILW